MKYLLGTNVSWHTLKGNIKEIGSRLSGAKLILLHRESTQLWGYLGFVNFNTWINKIHMKILGKLLM